MVRYADRTYNLLLFIGHVTRTNKICAARTWIDRYLSSTESHLEQVRNVWREREKVMEKKQWFSWFKKAICGDHGGHTVCDVCVDAAAANTCSTVATEVVWTHLFVCLFWAPAFSSFVYFMPWPLTACVDWWYRCHIINKNTAREIYFCISIRLSIRNLYWFFIVRPI